MLNTWTIRVSYEFLNKNKSKKEGKKEKKIKKGKIEGRGIWVSKCMYVWKAQNEIMRSLGSCTLLESELGLSTW